MDTINILFFGCYLEKYSSPLHYFQILAPPHFFLLDHVWCLYPLPSSPGVIPFFRIGKQIHIKLIVPQLCKRISCRKPPRMKSQNSASKNCPKIAIIPLLTVRSKRAYLVPITLKNFDTQMCVCALILSF